MPKKKKKPVWPADDITRVSTKDLIPYARNARTHSDSQVKQLAASIQEWGWTIPILIDEKNGIIAGHGRVMAAELLGFDEVPAMVAKGWTKAQKAAYVLADNKLTLNGSWDDDMLRVELTELNSGGFDMGLIGFDDEELADLVGEDEGQEHSSEGKDLALVNLNIADPKNKVQVGDVWAVGHHTLICASVIHGWELWSDFLVDGVSFAPFPGPFVPCSEKAAEHTLLMVQPDAYVAGHILDRYQEVYGDDSIEKVEQ